METNNKLRDTLVSVKKSIDEMGAASLDGDPEILLMSLTQVCARLSARIDAALAEPVRNCDVGTVEEQQARHCAWCRKHGIDGDNKVNCAHPDMSCILCTLRWAQMPYVEKDGDSDGSK